MFDSSIQSVQVHYFIYKNVRVSLLCCVHFYNYDSTHRLQNGTCGVDIVFGSSVINRAASHIAKPFDMNVNSNTSDETDETPLIVASCDGDLRTVCELMENESLDVNLSDSGGRTPLYFAYTKYHFQVTRSVGATVRRAQSDNSTTPTLPSGQVHSRWDQWTSTLHTPVPDMTIRNQG